MPYLDWSAEAVSAALKTESSSLSLMQLGIPAELWEPWLTELEACLRSDEQELRLELPKGWRLFWKVRADDSRLLLAHPEIDAYVGTLALNKSHADELLAKMRGGGGVAVRVGALGELASVSNFDLVIEKLAHRDTTALK